MVGRDNEVITISKMSGQRLMRKPKSRSLVVNKKGKKNRTGRRKRKNRPRRILSYQGVAEAGEPHGTASCSKSLGYPIRMALSCASQLCNLEEASRGSSMIPASYGDKAPGGAPADRSKTGIHYRKAAVRLPPPLCTSAGSPTKLKSQWSQIPEARNTRGWVLSRTATRCRD